MDEFGLRLKLARVYMGMSQTEMAEHLGVSLKMIYRWESGEREPPNTLRVREIAEKLQVPFEWLCGLGPTFAWEK